MEEIVALLIERHLSIASCESFTVGRFACEIGSVPGVSKVYRGSLVSYQTIVKKNVLNVDEVIIERYGVVSREVALAMCQRGSLLFDSDVCVSFTGNAGPSSMEGKPVGEIYIGLKYLDETDVYACHFHGSRKDIQDQAVAYAKEKLLEKLKSKTQ